MVRPIGLTGMPSPPVITLGSRCSLGGNGILLANASNPLTGTSPWSDAANTMMAFPFVVEVPTPVNKFFWVNGSAAGGNSEVILYDEAFNQIGTSTGSTAGSGNNVPQSVAPTGGAFTIPPGLYYCAMAHSATTTNQLFRWTVVTNGILFWMAAGCWKQAVTLGSLPSTATPADLTNVAFPLFGLITRTVFDA